MSKHGRQHLAELARRGLDLRQDVRTAFIRPDEKKEERLYKITEAAALANTSPATIKRMEAEAANNPDSNWPIPDRTDSNIRQYTLRDINQMRDHLSTRPQVRNSRNRPCIISLNSYKGGSGKSTLTVLLAQALARRGYRVCLIDTDPQGSTSSAFGAYDPALPFKYTSGAIFNNDDPADLPCTTLASIVQSTYWPTIDLIPASVDMADTPIRMAGGFDDESLRSFSELLDRDILVESLQNALRNGVDAAETIARFQDCFEPAVVRQASALLDIPVNDLLSLDESHLRDVSLPLDKEAKPVPVYTDLFADLLPKAVESLGTAYDVVLVDTSPTLDLSSICIAAGTDIMLIPAQGNYYDCESTTSYLTKISRWLENWSDRKRRPDIGPDSVRIVPNRFAFAAVKIQDSIISYYATHWAGSLIQPVLDSTAFARGAGAAYSIYDKPPSGLPYDRQTIDRAMTNFESVTDDVEGLIKSWSDQQ